MIQRLVIVGLELYGWGAMVFGALLLLRLVAERGRPRLGDTWLVARWSVVWPLALASGKRRRRLMDVLLGYAGMDDLKSTFKRDE